MMKRVCSVVCSAVVSLFALNGLTAATDGTWMAGNGSWTNAANWAEGIIANGGAARFAGPAAQQYQITVPAGYPFTLSELLFNTNGLTAAWTFTGETNTLVAPARFEINKENAFFKGQLTGSAGLHFVAKSDHSLTLENTNFFTGSVIVENGRLLPKVDESLGAVPPPDTFNAVVISNATFGNHSAPGMDIHPNRGITIIENAHFHGREGGGPGHLRIHSPITGDGNVWILRQTGFMEFSNPGNAYTGDTIFGGLKLGYNDTAVATATLRLGADEVIPHGFGKGRLLFANHMNGILDLQGHTETVNGIGSPESGDFTLVNSGAAQGTLKVGVDNSDSLANGTIGPGVTLEKIGTGALHFTDRSPADAAQGLLKLSEGSLNFTDPAHLGTQTLALNGGTLRHVDTQPGLAEYVGYSNGSSIDFSAPLTFCGIRLSPRMGDRGIIRYPSNTQHLYLGQWNVPSTGYYSFAQSFDDRSYLAIDGNEILAATSTGALTIRQGIHLTAGWHDIEIRVAQGIGDVGPRTNAMNTAIVYDPGDGDFSDFSTAREFKDTGDGTGLRTRSLGTDTVTARARAELLVPTTLDRSGTATSLVWSGDLASPNPATAALTVTGSTEAFHFGSTVHHPVFAADVNNANGVVFQDNVWLLTPPTSSSWSIAPGADIAVGAPGLFPGGDQALTTHSLRIPSTAPLGTGTETITVAGTGNAVTFDATLEQDTRLVDDPDYTFIAANDVVLSGTDAIVAFDGAGTVNYTGEISGNGSLVKNGSGNAILDAANPLFSGDIVINAGNLSISDDAQLGNAVNAITLNGGALDIISDLSLSRTIVLAGGDLRVADGASLTLSSALSGSLTKTGLGSWTLASANPALDLYVAEGDVALNAVSGVGVRNILGVDAGASVQIAANNGDQISGSVTLSGGVLDLAGRTETVKALNSASLAPLSLITNSALSSASLTVGDDNANGTYVGGLSGDLSFTKSGTGWLAIAGAADSQNATGALTVNGGQFALGLGIRQIRFVPIRTRTPNSYPTLSEFQITRNGKVVPWPAGTGTSGTTSTPGNQTANVISNNTRTAWQASTAQNQYFTIHLPEPVVFDGYRWFTSSTTVNSSSGDPVAWEIHVSTDTAGNPDNSRFHLADVRDVGTAISTLRGTKAGQWALNRYTVDALSPANVSVAAGAIFRSQLANHAVGTISGAGTLDLRPGVRLDVADLSAFTGTISGKDATLALGSAMPISLSSESTGVSVINGLDAPFSAILGTREETIFSGALKDGSAPIGLTKRGTSDMFLVDAGSAYTGDTVIESGALTVAVPPFNFRYIRFNVTAALDAGVDSAGYEMAYSEFQLLCNGQIVAWPDGTIANEGYVKGDKNHGDDAPMRVIDNNLNNRWLSQPLQPLVIDTKSGVTFDGYRYYVSKVNNQDRPRAPVAWTVDGSVDGVRWVPLDRQSGTAIPGYDTTVSVPPLIGPYALAGFSAFTRLPSALCAETPQTNRFLSGVTAQYLRFTVTQTSLEDRESGDDRGFQFSEFQLLANGVPLQWPAGTAATAPGGQWPANPGCNPPKVVNNTANAGAGDNDDRWLSDSLINPLTITLPAPVTFDAYQYITAHNVFGRNPTGWKLEVSTDDNTWRMVDDRLNETPPSSARAIVGPYPLMLPACDQAVDMIPDTSRVIVHAGAALCIAEGAIETIGPLSGTGTVAVADSAVLGINLTEDAVFAGAITGTNGTLALAGDHTQRFTGVTTTPGDLTVDFCGGRFGGLLRVGGALTVTGDVAYAMPTSLPATIPLFTFGSIGPASRDALVAGLSSLPVPKGYVANMRMTGTSATLTITAPGLLLLLQ